MRRFSFLVVLRLLLALPLVGLGVKLLSVAMGMEGLGAAAPALFGLSCFIAAAVVLSPDIAVLVSRPFGRWLGGLFYPEERLIAPPENLLFALRMHLRDRRWEAVEQQTAALLRAYGPSPELFHLRAHLAAGRDGDFAAVTVAAGRALHAKGFDAYLALLRHDPPSASAEAPTPETPADAPRRLVLPPTAREQT